jgi:hypothetical protein
VKSKGLVISALGGMRTSYIFHFGDKMVEAAEKRFKGLVVFYINIYPDLGQQMEPTVQMLKEMNKPLIERLAEDGRYLCLFIPTVKEATRIEKIDYDYPFPRCVAQSADVEREGVVIKKKKPSIFREEESLNGIITLYINFHPEIKLLPREVIAFIQTFNQDVLKQIADDGRYQIMFVPTTKEATRIEKIDYDSPFPRFVPKSTKSRPALMPKTVTKEEDDEEDEEGEE